MRHTLILIYLLCLSPLAALASYDKPPIPGDWQLSFSDDFDHLDTEKWNTSLPLGRVRLGGSICFFLDENVTTANGDLIISSNQGKHELTGIKGQRFQRDYHSGQINSFGKFTQQYGYFEARMKLPQSAGLRALGEDIPASGKRSGTGALGGGQFSADRDRLANRGQLGRR